MKEDKVFLDTNILVYAYDVSFGSKNDIARNIVAAAIKSGHPYC